MSNPVTISLTVTIPSLSQSPTHSCAAPAIAASAATAALGSAAIPVPHSSASNAVAPFRRSMRAPNVDDAACR